MDTANEQRLPKRIRDERQRLADLSAAAGFWTVTPTDQNQDGAHEISIEIQGRSIASAGPADDQIQFGKLQKIRLILPTDFPENGPTLRVDSPVFHPNIAADGIVELQDIGLHWAPAMTLDLVVERIWDTLRGHHIDSRNAIHVGAGQWYLRQSQTPSIGFPVDPRPLFVSTTKSSNIVRYRKLDQPFRNHRVDERIVIDESSTPDSSFSNEHAEENPIHFID